jgi:hypothetical protein
MAKSQTAKATTPQVLSPFLPGTKIQYAWDSTSLGYIKTCPRLYQYIMIDGWGEKDQSIHLRFGIEYHKALEEYDSARIRGESHENAVCYCIHQLLCRIRDWNPDSTTRAGNYKNPRTLLQLVVDYVDKYKDDPAKTVTLENGKPALELSFRFELDWGPSAGQTYERDIPHGNPSGHNQPYVLCGHLDRVVSYNDQTLVMDRKTTTMDPGSRFYDQFSPNNQMTLYTLAGQVVLDTVIKGVVIDAAKPMLEVPNVFGRGFTYRTPAQLEEWLNDLRIHLYMAEQYATIGYWPQNDTACDKFGGCRFRGVCSRDPSVRGRFLEADFVKQEEGERWNPLKPR